MRSIPANIVRGFLMGAADVVPGVSGGTVALVLGIYDRLVASIRAGSSALLALGRGAGRDAGNWLRRVEWTLLIPLAIGIALAVVLFARVLEDQLRDRPIHMAALFLGLVAGSTVVAWRLITSRDGRRLGIIAATAVIVFVALGIPEGTSADAVVQADDPAIWAFFASGAVAICAMILPGISGSFILVMLGMYAPVLGAVNDRNAVTIAVFAGGALIGLAAFSQLLHRALSTHYDTVMAGLIGLMLGSLRVLWPWPAGVESTALGTPDHAVVPSLLLAALGFAVVLAVSATATRTTAAMSPTRRPS